MTAVAAAVVRGIPASKGVASGPVFTFMDGAPGSADAGIDYDAAVALLSRRLEDMAGSLPQGRAAGGEILRAQAAMARDPALAGAVRKLQAAGRSLVDAITTASEAYAQRLDAIDDPYLKERAADVRDVGRQLVQEVTGAPGRRLAALDRPSIVVAHRLSPVDTLSVSTDLLLGIVTEEGGVTSHAAIVARELGIPAVVGAAGAVDAAAGHAAAEIDGGAGELRFLPDAAPRAAAADEGRIDVSAAPVVLMANVGSLAAALAAARRGAAGIGLFRTEFMFMAATGPMSEDEQFAVYDAACAAMSPHHVVVRTLDAGADKPLPYLRGAREPNPQLGRRGVRLWLEHADVWRSQVRGLLRAGDAHANLRVMLPMIAARGEMVAARALFELEAAKLGLKVPQLGMMVEVPAAAACLRAFDGVADFISLGTNDLTQYATAADRELEWGAELGEFNPGVLRLIATAIGDARRMGIPAGVCGELAGRPEGAVFLIGAGAGSLSMTADALAGVLAASVEAGRARCERAAAAALAAADAPTALAALRGVLAEP